MKRILIACEVFYRECCAAVAQAPVPIDVRFLPKGLHDLGSQKMGERLQAEIDDISDRDHDTILMGYGLCNNGVAGLTARAVPIVIPRVHDCIHLLMGDTQRYLDYTEKNPGTYYRSTGWLERGDIHQDLQPQSIQHQYGMDLTREEYIEQYGEENGNYLYEMLGNQTRNYNRMAFIETGIEPNDSFRKRTQAEAQEHGWDFDTVKGDLNWLRSLMNGPWEEECFLIVPPGETIQPDYAERIMQIEGDTT